MTPELRRVESALLRKLRARTAYENAIREACETETIRTVAKAARLSPARVHQIVHRSR